LQERAYGSLIAPFHCIGEDRTLLRRHGRSGKAEAHDN
jgi:hypothetical protein